MTDLLDSYGYMLSNRAKTFSIGQDVQNFCALYAIEVIHGYTDGRIKARTARGAYVDLPRQWALEKDYYAFDPQHWVRCIQAADAAFANAPGKA